MNVLMLRPQVELGGVTTHIGLLGAELVARGHAVSLITTRNSANEQFEKGVRSRGVKLFSGSLYPSTPYNLYKSIVDVSRIVRQNNIDILHSHHRFTTVVGRLVSVITNTPLVVTVHEFKQNWRLLASLWQGNITITPSQALKDHLQSVYKIADAHIFVIPHAIQAQPEYNPARIASLRERLNLTPTSICITFIGRLSEEKGCQFFIEAVPLIERSNKDIRFMVIGSGPDETALQRQAQKLGQDIAFLGNRNDISDLLQLTNIVVIPSVTESFSLVALEAMLAARPVVAAAAGGLVEVVRHGITGFLVPPKSPSHIAESVLTLVHDPELRDRLGLQGKHIVLEEYTTSALAERTIEVYKFVLSSGK
jgi:glycosyltransferase involved in cell wall biosynthesis